MIGQLFTAYDLRLYVEPISSCIVCNINHPGLLKPLRKIDAIEWYCNI